MKFLNSGSCAVLALALCSNLSVSAAFAQDAEKDQTENKTEVGADHAITVSASFIDDVDFLAGVSVLQGIDLSGDIRTQIGDTLTSLPGVSATSFAPGASRPVLRGFQGPRVRVLIDGIGTLDVASTSPDHAVTVDPITAESIEILRGPAVLLYGGSAIGGAVNVIDARIPRNVPENGFNIKGAAGYGSAADDFNVAGAADFALGSKFVAHIDASYRETNDLDIPGLALAPELRQDVLDAAAATADPDEAAELLEVANQSGTLINSATETTNLGAGISFIDDFGSLGISAGYYDTDYGLPIRPLFGEGAVTIALEQFRVDLRGSVNLGGGFFEKLNIRTGYSDVRQEEIIEDEVETLFLVDGIEARFELVQSERNGWRGVIGGQLLIRDLFVEGEEAFVPNNSTESVSIFTVQELDLGNFELEGAGRYERTTVQAPTIGFDRSFDAFSAALSFSYSPENSGLELGVNLSRAERAPSSEELLSDGPHVAIQAFEIGNPGFDTEKSLGAEAFLRWQNEDFAFSVTGYVTDFDDFIFEIGTGGIEDGLPIFQFFQNDATFYGFEVSGSARLAEIGGFKIVGDVVADAVRASLGSGAGPVPRIPPLRILGGLEAQGEQFKLRGEVEWSDDQDRVQAFETATDGFTLVNLSASFEPFGKDTGVALLASANNIFDVTARRHASFTKDFVPFSGRDFRLSLKLAF